ncbi:pentapeptide repeat-containing protein [Actinosynnema sp. NPDC047251]
MSAYRTPRLRRALPSPPPRVVRLARLLNPVDRKPRSIRGRAWNWTAFAAVLAALAAGAGVVFTGLALQATRAQNAVTEQGQLTDRFTKAVDQLDRTGPDHLQARLGGIYALERLARDSPRDQPTVIAALSAFVRGTAPRRPAPVPSTAHTPTPASGFEPCAQQPAVDVQAALTVLGRRATDQDQRTRINLAETCLARANLARADLTGANLANADLTLADLAGANLANTDLSAAKLANADLVDRYRNGADLAGAYLVDANLAGANLINADLARADLTRADLTRADLARADLTRVDLTHADLTAANLSGTRR